MFRKLLLGILLLLMVGTVGVFVAIAVTAPEGPAAGSRSAELLAPGPHPVGTIDISFVDESRSTAANGDFEGAPSRTLHSTLWFPKATGGDLPLVVYSHGFMSTRAGGTYLARHLASHGIVVISADFPLTSFTAPGGPNVADVASQPGDVSFLIDSVLALEGDAKPFDGQIDPEKIGAMGLSLGGLTTTLVTFHPALRDSRIQAAVSIAGPGTLFSERFFETAPVPFLMIAGTEDAMIDYEANASVIPERAPTGALLTIEGASHTAFTHIAEPAMRLLNHPDSLGCGALMANLDTREGENPFPGLGGEEMGIVLDRTAPMPCQKQPLAKAMHPGRQHMITLLAVTDFFVSTFDDDTARREAAEQHLVKGLARDFAEASYLAYTDGAD